MYVTVGGQTNAIGALFSYAPPQINSVTPLNVRFSLPGFVWLMLSL